MIDLLHEGGLGFHAQANASLTGLSVVSLFWEAVFRNAQNRGF